MVPELTSPTGITPAGAFLVGPRGERTHGLGNIITPFAIDIRPIDNRCSNPGVNCGFTRFEGGTSRQLRNLDPPRAGKRRHDTCHTADL